MEDTPLSRYTHWEKRLVSHFHGSENRSQQTEKQTAVDLSGAFAWMQLHPCRWAPPWVTDKNVYLRLNEKTFKMRGVLFFHIPFNFMQIFRLFLFFLSSEASNSTSVTPVWLLLYAQLYKVARMVTVPPCGHQRWCEYKVAWSPPM